MEEASVFFESSMNFSLFPNFSPATRTDNDPGPEPDSLEADRQAYRSAHRPQGDKYNIRLRDQSAGDLLSQLKPRVDISDRAQGRRPSGSYDMRRFALSQFFPKRA